MLQRNLFVYGTLRRAFNHPFYAFMAKNATFVAEGTVNATLYDLGEYPGAVPSQTNLVHGEVYLLSKKMCEWTLSKLDEYEGYLNHNLTNSLFVREWVTVSLPDKQVTQAWMYWYQHSVTDAVCIASGDYVAYQAEK